MLIDVWLGSEGRVRPKRLVDKAFRREDQDQLLLLALDVRDWLPAGGPVCWVDGLVEHGLDLGPFCDDLTKAGAPGCMTRG